MHGPSHKMFRGAGWLGLLMMLTLLTTPAAAVNKYWATTGNAWSAAANWNPAGAPVTGDNVFLTFNDANNRSIYYYMPTVPAVFNSFTMDQTGTGTLSFFQGYNSYTFPFAAQVEVIGKDGKAVYQHTLGSNTVIGSFFMAYNAGSSATYQLSNTASLSAANEYVGDFGTGLFQQTGGTNTANNILYIGYGPPSTGTYQLGGTGALIADTLLVGHLGTGTLTQTGGSASSTYTRVGGATGKTGTYVMQGGTFLTQSMSVGYKGTGVVNHSAGQISVVGESLVGESAGSVGTYTLSDPGSTGTYLSTDYSYVGFNGAGTFNHLGGTHAVNNTLVVAYNPGSSGAYTLKGGTLTTYNAIQVNQNGTFTQEGGEIQQPGFALTNYGTFLHKAGTFNSHLNNYGTATFQGNFASAYDLYNYGQALVPAGGTIYKYTTPMYNYGFLTMTGGAIHGDTDFYNYGYFQGYGTIGGSYINNNAYFTQDGGNLRFSSLGGVTNLASMDFQAGRIVQLETSLNNFGALRLNSALVSGGGYLGNYGTLEGPGIITAPFGNYGNLQVLPGNTIISQFSGNYGQIVLTGSKSTLGGSNIHNDFSGRIRGSGTVLQNVENYGAIEASGGALTFVSPVSFYTGSQLSAEAGASAIFTTWGIYNNGVMNLRGGTIAPGQSFYNYAVVAGFGTLDGKNTYNYATATFASGVSTVNGSFYNYQGGYVNVDHGQVIFTGYVENQAGGTFKNTGGVFTFAGGFLNNGTYFSDPATQTFHDLAVGTSGVLLGATGDYFLIGNDFLNRSGNNLHWNTLLAELDFINGSDNRHLMLLAGADRGAGKLGFKNNFAWGVLDISQQFLELQDGNDILGGAFYVGEILGADLRGDMVANILGHGLNIYYDPLRPGNDYLLGQRYAFLDGGYLAPVGYAATPLPGSLILVLSGLLGLTGMGLRSRGRQD